MNTDDINTKLSEYLSKEILKQPNRMIKPDEPLLSSGLIDSFHLVDLALFVEDNFDVHIDELYLNNGQPQNIVNLSGWSLYNVNEEIMILYKSI